MGFFQGELAMVLLIYLCLFIFIIFIVVVMMMGLEQLLAFFSKTAPSIPSGQKLRDIVVKEIAKELPRPKTILDIGSGWGHMVRSVSDKFPSARVVGVEIMPSPYIYSKLWCVFKKNIKIHFGNAFKFLKNHNEKFDVGIAYLLTPEMKDVEKFLSKFKVLMILDFPLPGVKPVRTVVLHKDRLGHHHLYVYKGK